MAGDITLRIDSREFDVAWKQYLRQTSKTVAQAINTKALDIVQNAMRFTKRASKSDILALGGSYVTVGKRGKALKRARFVSDPHGRIRSIIVGKLRRQGKLASAANVSAMAKKELGRRMRSIGYLASGWIPAIRRFLSVARGPRFSASAAGVRQFGRAKGKAMVAREGPKPFAVFENNVTPIGPNGSSLSTFATGLMTRALQEGVNEVARDIERYMAGKMEDLSKKYGRRR